MSRSKHGTRGANLKRHFGHRDGGERSRPSEPGNLVGLPGSTLSQRGELLREVFVQVRVHRAGIDHAEDAHSLDARREQQVVSREDDVPWRRIDDAGSSAELPRPSVGPLHAPDREPDLKTENAEGFLVWNHRERDVLEPHRAELKIFRDCRSSAKPLPRGITYRP